MTARHFCRVPAASHFSSSHPPGIAGRFPALIVLTLLGERVPADDAIDSISDFVHGFGLDFLHGYKEETIS